VGIVLQQSGVEDELTVREALAAQRRPYSNPLPVDEVIDTVDLNEKSEARIKTLSGGQRRRLDLALAIVGNPDLLFLDEPTTGFDPGARRRSWEAITRLSEQGATIVLTTHYLEEAHELADRVIVMAEGLIAADGPPDDLGDRREGRTTITFRVDPSRAADIGVTADTEGKVEIETDDPVTAVHDLTSGALRARIEIYGLEVRKLTLEEAYLRLVAPDG
jgi:ABC-2 type transport system ATP-binding protein